MRGGSAFFAVLGCFSTLINQGHPDPLIITIRRRKGRALRPGYAFDWLRVARGRTFMW